MKRFSAILLALILLLALCACAGGEQSPAGADGLPAQGGAPDSAGPALGETASGPSSQAPEDPALPIPDRGTPPGEDTAAPAGSPSPDGDDRAEEPSAPAASPAPTPDGAPPTEAVPSPTPTPEPTPTPAPDAPAAVTAADVFEQIAAAAGLGGFMDASVTLEFEYDLSAEELEDYGFYLPDMSAELQEVFIARVKPGGLKAAEAACAARQQGLAEDAALYQSTGAYVEDYRLIARGDWLLFYVGPNGDRAVEAFQNTVN